MSANIYSRKISSKEAQKGFIFILKDKLSFFPDINDTFELMDGKTSRDVMVDSYPCTCRGPDRPHEHYFIQWEGLEAGDKIEITKDPKNEDKYNLKIQ
jgi:hypothetical protein